MPYVLADQNGWLENGKEPFDFKILNTFENMINSVRLAHLITALIAETDRAQRSCGNTLPLKSIMIQVVCDISEIYTLRKSSKDEF